MTPVRLLNSLDQQPVICTTCHHDAFTYQADWLFKCEACGHGMGGSFTIVHIPKADNPLERVALALERIADALIQSHSMKSDGALPRMSELDDLKEQLQRATAELKQLRVVHANALTDLRITLDTNRDLLNTVLRAREQLTNDHPSISMLRSIIG